MEIDDDSLLLTQEGRTTCVVCKEKGHFSATCNSPTTTHRGPIIASSDPSVDDVHPPDEGPADAMDIEPPRPSPSVSLLSSPALRPKKRKKKSKEAAEEQPPSTWADEMEEEEERSRKK